MRKAVVKFLTRAAGMAFLFAVLLVLAGALALSWLGGSEAGRAWIAGQASALASSEELIVEIEGIKTLSSSQLAVSSIILKDEAGVFSKIGGAEMDYDAAHMLAGNLHIDRINIEEVFLKRIPESREEKSGGDDIAFPEIPDLHIESLNVENIHLAPEITGQKENLSLSGALVLSPALHENFVSLHLKDGHTSDSLADLTFDPEEDDLKLSVSVQDDGNGLLARLSGLPLIDASLEGSGTLERWAGQLKVSAGEAFQTGGQVVLSLGAREPALTYAGKARYKENGADGEVNLTLYPKSEKAGLDFNGDLEASGYGLRGLSLKSEIKVEKTLFGAAGSEGVDLSFTGDVARVVDLSAGTEIDPLSGVVVEAQGHLDGDRVNIKSGRVKTDHIEVKALGEIDLETNRMKASVESDVKDLGGIAPELSGSGTANVQISGSLEPIDLQAQTNFQLQGFKSAWPEVNDALGPSPNARAQLYYSDKLAVQDGVLKGAKLKALNFSGFAVGNQARFNFSTNYVGYGIETVLNFEESALVFDPVSVAGDLGKLTGEAGYNLEKGEVQAALTLSLDKGHTVSLKLSGPPELLSYSGDLRGEAAYPFTFAYQGEIDSRTDTVIKLAGFSGDYGPVRLALKRPASVILEDGGAEIENLALGVNDGVINASGQFGAEEFTAALNAQNLPANPGIFPSDYNGRFDADAQVSGPYANPSGEAQVDLKRVVIPGIGEAGEQYVSGTLTASYQNNTLTAQADLGGPAEFRLTGGGSLPLTISPFGIPAGGQMRGNVSASLDLKALSLLFGLDQHSISGGAAIELALSGAFNKPVITGEGRLRNGTYENLLTGTRFEDVSAELRASKNSLSLENLEGRDINGGSFTGGGRVDFSNLDDPQYRFDLSTRALQLVNTDRMGVSASSQLNAAGDMDRAEITGQVRIDEAEYYISQLISASSLGDYTIIEENGHAEEKAKDQDEQGGPVIGLSVVVEANNNIFVRGPDLETEWSGKLNVTGSAGDPEIRGNLSLVRGRFMLLDAPVQLSKGDIRFAGADPSNPYIDLTGVIKGRGMDSTLRITGEAKSPEIGLQSEPPLPEDEILARTLFGTSVGQLSPVQALKIAQLMAYLSGRESASFDPLNDIRRAVGIDTLSVGMDEEKGATLSVGKYVSDKIYVGVEQGASPGSTAVRAEIEVTDDIEVETKTGNANESSVGVNWKRDY